MARIPEKVELIYVDLSGYDPSNPNKLSPVVPAGEIAGDGDLIKDKKCELYISAFYCADLPDWTKVNEALLMFDIGFIDEDGVDNVGSFSREFRVIDASSPGGFLHFRPFKNITFGRTPSFSVSLDEIDKKFDISGIMKILQDTDIREGLNLGAVVPYVELGSKIYNGIADLVVENDPVWKETAITFSRDHNGRPSGPAALKDGIYCLLSTTDTKGKNIKTWRDDYSDIGFLNNVLYQKKGANAELLETNYLVFSLTFYNPTQSRSTKLIGSDLQFIETLLVED